MMSDAIQILRDYDKDLTVKQRAAIAYEIEQLNHELEWAANTITADTLAIQADRDRLRDALVRVYAHTTYMPPGSHDLLAGMVASIARISGRAIGLSTEQPNENISCEKNDVI